MITESHIHLPLLDNNGNCLAHDLKAITLKLLNAFGGLSIGSVQGMWQNPETYQVYNDQCQRITIAKDWSESIDCGNRTQETLLFEIAEEACRYMDQDCIYVVTPSGAHFIEPLKTALAA